MNGTILKTTNGGDVWFVQASGTTYALVSVHFVNSQTGYAVGAGGIILKTTNGGGAFVKEYPLEKTAFVLYPNPAKDKINIVNKSDLQKETVVSIYNIHGKLLVSKTFQNLNIEEIDVSGLAKGVYMVKIQIEKGYAVEKLLIQ